MREVVTEALAFGLAVAALHSRNCRCAADVLH
jgi:hypothetical protein